MGQYADVETSGRANNFGVIRLLLASLVAVGHVPYMVDGGTSRDLLTRALSVVNFAELGVDGFFTISGFLIAKSFLSSRNGLPRFVASRVLRIYPGFCVAYVISIYVVGHFADGDLSYALSYGLLRDASRMLFLMQPKLPGVFSGVADEHLNGPLWSLSREFGCYAAVVVLGACGVYAKRWRFLVIWAVCALLMLDPPLLFLRMFAIFTCGSAFYVFRDRIQYRFRYCLLAFAVWCLFMHFTPFGQFATATLLAYVIFYAAFAVRIPWLNRVGQANDVSYGMYLYAWPITNLIIYHDRGISPSMLILIALPSAAVAGFASWKLIEQPALRLKSMDWAGLLPKRIAISR